MPITYLFEVDTLPTSVGACEDLHAAMLFIKTAVVGHEWAHTQLLQEVSCGEWSCEGEGSGEGEWLCEEVGPKGGVT